MEHGSAIPAHLRRYVVRQNYAAYTARDQAVWRFVLTQTHALLQRTAHWAYAPGFDAVGIEIDRIPEIAQMSDRLASCSFRAVCVDGFIPPRAFQAFQARGVLPIAADIRSGEHLTYTPAPDIIHEAAGHAPFLAEPDYARYLRRIGEVSEHAFESAHDRRLYQAIYTLSELKEDPASTPEQIVRAEALLARVRAEASTVSESTRMARLYWWTVEYGLVGTCDDFRLYGAGLLSSIGEAHFCHERSVRKLPLDASCVEVDYDITRAQPQLFVAADFAELPRVLEDVANTLSYRRGGAAALLEAERSEEPATLELDSGLQVTGVVRTSSPQWVRLAGGCALARHYQVLAGLPRATDYVLPLGRFPDGTPWSALSPEALARACDSQGRMLLTAAGGLSVRGTPRELVVEDGRVLAAVLEGCEITCGGEPLLRAEAPYPLAFAEHVVTASAAVPEAFYPATEFTDVTVPKPRQFGAAERGLIAMHEQAEAILRGQLGSAAGARLAELHQQLVAEYPDEWLLRWNLLEALIRLGSDPQCVLAERLESELERLEIRYMHREPIATGLAHLRALAGAGAARSARDR